jgi:hypothetical protein
VRASGMRRAEVRITADMLDLRQDSIGRQDTSRSRIPHMTSRRVELGVINPGRVYRVDDDQRARGPGTHRRAQRGSFNRLLALRD